MKALDLFSGTGNFSEGFRRLGWDVDRVEKDARFADVPDTTIADVLEWKPRTRYDVVVGSPPCNPFTMAGGKQSRLRWHHANGNGPYPFFGPRLPTAPASFIGCALVLQARRIIDSIQPRFFFLENPQGGLQTMGFMDDLPRTTVTYCQYGEARMKPTTIFGAFPETWKPRPRCQNGDPCHPAARRGAKTGTQGLRTSRERAAIPMALSDEIAAACEAAIQGGPRE